MKGALLDQFVRSDGKDGVGHRRCSRKGSGENTALTRLGSPLNATDPQLEASAPQDLSFAGRTCQPDRFAMSCGVVVPVYRELLEEVTRDLLAWRRGDPERVAEDP